MYQTSENYKSKIYLPSTKHILRVYINGIEIDRKHILDIKISHMLFDNEEFYLGSVAWKKVDLKLYKDAVPNTIENITIVSGIEGEEIPIGIFNVDDISRDDDYTVNLKLIDNMVKFEYKYDGSELINENGYAELIDVLRDICQKARVVLGTTSFLNMNKRVAVYDNTISARAYLSFISEQAGGFACIGRDGALYIRTIGESIAQISLKNFKNFKWGEQFVFSRVRYEDGIQLFEQGDTTGNTIYINQDNMYIVEQEQIDNIYNQINGLDVYGFEGESIIDPALDVGDLLLIDNKYVIYQGNLSYGGKFVSSIMSKIQSKEKQESMIRTPSQKTINRRVQSHINQIDGEITQLAEQTDENSTSIAQHQISINNINSSVKLLGGNNKQRNSIGAYGTNDFEQSQTGTIIAAEEELLKTTTDNGFGRIIYIGSQKWFKFKSESLVIGDTYTLSFKYLNTADNQCTINFINNNTTNLVNTTVEKDLTTVEYTFVANTEFVELYVSTGQGVVGITDYYLQTGDVANKWQPASGEALSTVLSIYYNGIKVSSENSEIVTNISNLGFSVTNTNGKMLITFNKDKCILSDTDLNGVLNQSGWKRYTQTINSKVHLLEVYN